MHASPMPMPLLPGPVLPCATAQPARLALNASQQLWQPEGRRVTSTSRTVMSPVFAAAVAADGIGLGAAGARRVASLPGQPSLRNAFRQPVRRAPVAATLPPGSPRAAFCSRLMAPSRPTSSPRGWSGIEGSPDFCISDLSMAGSGSFSDFRRRLIRVRKAPDSGHRSSRAHESRSMSTEPSPRSP